VLVEPKFCAKTILCSHLQTLKKNQVDKHAQRCRNCHAVTCVDCSVTFYGNDYAQHITCVSEAEKYEKTLYKPKAGKANPQDAWNDLIQTACSKVDTAPQIVRPYLQRVSDLSNVPRNKKKFINFAKNSLRLYSDNVLEALWTYLDTFRVDAKKETESKPSVEAPTSSSAKSTAAAQESAVPVSSTETDTSDAERAKKEKKKAKKEKRKREAEEEPQETAEPAVNEAAEEDVPEPVKEQKKKKSKKDKSQ
jgi:cell growth-regulating nucleolar protein